MSEPKRFNQQDWSAWSGCENFSDGSEPFVHECGEWIFAADKNGIEASYLDLATDDDDTTYRLEFDGRLTAALAELILNGLPDEITLEQIKALGMEAI